MSALYQFDADQAGSEESNDVLTVGVAKAFGPYFMIKRPLGKEKLSGDELYAEHDDQGKGAFGSLQHVELTREVFTAKLQDGTTIIASLKIDDDSWTKLKFDLLRALSGFDELHTIK